MKLRPMNKTLIIELEENVYQTDSEKVSEVLNAKDRKIILPEENTLEKISDHAKVIRASNDCYYTYKKNQRICYNQFADTPVWYEEDGKKYRIIKENYIHYKLEEI